MGRWKNYHWIPPVDHTIFSKERYRSQVLNATLSKCGTWIIMELDMYFPVGSIFHSIHGDVDYVIKSQDRGTYKNRYKVTRCDNTPVTLNDAYWLKERKWIYRDGFESAT